MCVCVYVCVCLCVHVFLLNSPLVKGQSLAPFGGENIQLWKQLLSLVSARCCGARAVSSASLHQASFALPGFLLLKFRKLFLSSSFGDKIYFVLF